ncbi:exopolyphosphatase-like protein [Lophium mytilinum]|uniref:Exopolyphosphatase-like protein n=1 Tax=Lophium mytilinum TaxID=390894 RepID=A0A6A6QJ64_9PEZI|nr:exopolyphosphatase-like protein [Lophium mytilinum]
MSIPRRSLRTFLITAKDAIRTAVDNSQKITFVIGNESADLDSLTCSILYAYLRSSCPPPHAFTPLFVPVANIPASGIQLRPELLALLPHADIEEKHLITLDDIPELSSIKSRLRPENTKWILVDHNALQGTLGSIYSERVGGVIDHHDEENKVSADTADEPRIIEKAGSCTSLVTEYCRGAWDAISDTKLSSGAAHAQGDEAVGDGAVRTLWDAQVAQLGLASILIDTSNLQSKEKTTGHDVTAAEYLEAKIMACTQVAGGFDRTKFYKEIDTAKKNIGGLKLQDILRKDYKQWTEGGLKLGISSVVKSLNFLQEKAQAEANGRSTADAFYSAVREFADEQELDMYAIMTTSTSPEGNFQRELLLWAFTADTVATAQKFETNATGELGLESWHGSDGRSHDEDSEKDWRKVWRQRSVQHSRKRVAPLLREAMS